MPRGEDTSRHPGRQVSRNISDWPDPKPGTEAVASMRNPDGVMNSHAAHSVHPMEYLGTNYLLGAWKHRNDGHLVIHHVPSNTSARITTSRDTYSMSNRKRKKIAQNAIDSGLVSFI